MLDMCITLWYCLHILICCSCTVDYCCVTKYSISGLSFFLCVFISNVWARCIVMLYFTIACRRLVIHILLVYGTIVGFCNISLLDPACNWNISMVFVISPFSFFGLEGTKVVF